MKEWQVLGIKARQLATRKLATHMDVSKFEQWLKDGVGRAKEGPIGSIFDSAMNTVVGGFKYVQNYAKEHADNVIRNYTVERNEFELCLLILAAEVMRADGSPKAEEIAYVRDFYVRNFGEEHIESRMKLLNIILEKEFSVRKVSQQIKRIKSHAVRLQLVHFMFAIAEADGDISPTEATAIRLIASHLGVSRKDYKSIHAMFMGSNKIASVDMNTYYTILEVDSKASDDEVKRAYRRMAKKYHPDRVSTLGEDVQKAAQQKFQKLLEAYDMIKKERGIS